VNIEQAIQRDEKRRNRRVLHECTAFDRCRVAPMRIPPQKRTWITSSTHHPEVLDITPTRW